MVRRKKSIHYKELLKILIFLAKQLFFSKPVIDEVGEREGGT